MPSTDTLPGAAALTGDATTQDAEVEAEALATDHLRLIAPPEAAEILGLSVNALGLMRSRSRPDAPRGPRFVKIGPKAVRYRKIDLIRWVMASTRVSTHDEG